MAKIATIQNQPIYLAEPEKIPDCNFIGRDEELALCRAAWGVDEKLNEPRSDNATSMHYELRSDNATPMHFRLQGPPGMGKNEIVYQLARQLEIDLYLIQGHEEITPEDLSLLLVPEVLPEVQDDDDKGIYSSETGLILRASPLATAIYEGALLFFDEINRVPERALSPLSSVLDGRQYIYSAMTGIKIEPRDDEAKKRFRFCCALNPGLSQSGHVLPEYIEQRTLPVIEVEPPPFEEVREILQKSLSPSLELLDAFEKWYQEEENADISVRQAISLVNYARNYKWGVGDTEYNILKKIQKHILGRQRSA
ncbi:MAG: MoxR family ATPase [Xenococcaceae cyanobacterium MO_167.B27]|nr:MoxR family ATPase [Xenococcaceae cyanobacterium MO_167.B27]